MTASALPFAGWQDIAACRGTDPEDFFPEGDPASPVVAFQVARAKAVCGTCPARRPCLDFAEETAIGWGVWGGMSEQERAADRARRNRRAA